MDRRPRVAARQLAAASPVKIDYGRVRWQASSTSGEQIFVNAVGIGFDAHVAARAAAFKFLPGVVGYLVAALQTLRRWEAPAVRVTGPAETIVYEGRLLLVTAGNGVCSGGMFYLTPSASITDGLLDLCLVEQASFLRVLRLLPLAVQGRHEPEPEVRTGRFRTLRVTAEAGVPIHTDLEVQVLNAHTIDVEIIPGGLSVLMPD
jgi:diacylglycerol kinase family enzyme